MNTKKYRNNEKRTIYILHEYGAPSHYRSLSWYAENIGNDRILFREFSILRKTSKSILKLDYELFWKQVTNVILIINLIFSRHKYIIIGIAPYDWRLLYLFPILRKHKYFYHTSKTTWGYVNYSKRFLAKTQTSRKVWTKFIENSNGIFCVTKKSAKELRKYYNVNHISVVNHSLPKLFEDAPFPKKTQKKHINCLFVGRYTESKGIQLIFDIINDLPKDSYKFYFVGNGELKKEIDKFCDTRANCNNLGAKYDNELLAIYDNCDVLLLPSQKKGPWEELFGMVLIEAMARKVIPISTKHTGPSEIISDTENGFLLEEKQYIEGTVRILNDLRKNPSLLAKLRDSAFLRSQDYSCEIIYKRWEELLH